MKYQEIYDFALNILIFSIFGAIFGSFANCIGSRLFNEKISIGKKKSQCLNCGNKILLLDLIPIFSYLKLGGKCRFCKAKIPKYYLISEIFLSIVFSLMYLKFGLGIISILFCILFLFLTIQCISDIRNMLASDVVSILIFGICLIIIYNSNITFLLAMQRSISIVSFFLLLRYLLLILFKKDVLGLGDVKIFASLGMLLSLELFFIFIGLCGFFNLIFVRLSKSNNSEFPFLPSIILSFLAIVLLLNI